ncbi:MAG TPA: FAD-dependent oxidoreductase [Dehalococcoidia bacterium]|nr:FAD-dependent oxidoreductase [Dehalococcoidia bacterium]
MKRTDIAVCGSGPAGLSAAISAASLGAQVTLFEREDVLGGQLVKQIHKFFGSEKQYAATRGIEIARILARQVEVSENIQALPGTTVLGRYRDGSLMVERGQSVEIWQPQRLIVATGASETMLPFPGNDLPGVYGAGAVQTLMNVYGVAPGRRVLMVGAGNIGLIVSFQLLQAGINVEAVVEAAPQVGGYLVHAAKLRRQGVPILTSHTIKEAHGVDGVEGATIVQVSEDWQPIDGTERFLEVDTVCLAVGLSPLAELLWQAGCQMRYVPELGGHSPVRNEHMETTVKGVYAAGDVAGVEEASTALLEGQIAGLAAAASLGYSSEDLPRLLDEAMSELVSLRAGPRGEKVRRGISQVLRHGETA